MTETNLESIQNKMDTNLQNIISILKYPVISDKSTLLLENNKYTFMVDRRANKVMIKKVIEYVFNVSVTNINTLRSPAKKRTVGRFSGYRSQYKKAIVTVKDGDTITLFPDM
jgi:large subunit ribosomal protein L23